ncbi:YueI family protein [Neobacillus notoginsengisoli]|uniref:YueI family protein n=1 Tax=Neobacillus notoginsengisoli TaxID=1578198 RepID=UPI001F027E0F|nr:YueI family protein [Neobacillus notoginsengisoli]
MPKPSVDEILQQGIHGQKELRPEERRRYLGTFRERVLIALTKMQVYEPGTFPEVEQLMKEYPDAQLFMNGHMSYEEFSKYLRMANEHNIEYTIVTNKEHDSELGLVLACQYAVDREEIYLKEDSEAAEDEGPAAEKKGFFAKLTGWFRK